MLDHREPKYILPLRKKNGPPQRCIDRAGTDMIKFTFQNISDDDCSICNIGVVPTGQL